MENGVGMRRHRTSIGDTPPGGLPCPLHCRFGRSSAGQGRGRVVTKGCFSKRTFCTLQSIACRRACMGYCSTVHDGAGQTNSWRRKAMIPPLSGASFPIEVVRAASYTGSLLLVRARAIVACALETQLRLSETYRAHGSLRSVLLQRCWSGPCLSEASPPVIWSLADTPRLSRGPPWGLCCPDLTFF